MMQIKFQTMENGQRVAYRWHRLAARWIRMSMAQAEIMVATGQANA
jgi:hypothetical protein